MEKENGIFSLANGGAYSEKVILPAVVAYYLRLIQYTSQVLANELSKASSLPKFSNPIPVVVSGGTSRASGFVYAFEQALKEHSLPFQIKEVRPAKDQLRAVARGCLIAAGI